MPHYKDGSESKVGDTVKGTDMKGNPLSGIVVSKMPGKKPDMIVMETIFVYVWGHDMELVVRPGN